MTQRPAPSLRDLSTLLNRRALMNADERMTLIFEGLWITDLMHELQGLGEGPEDEEARRRIHRLLTKGG